MNDKNQDLQSKQYIGIPVDCLSELFVNLSTDDLKNLKEVIEGQLEYRGIIFEDEDYDRQYLEDEISYFKDEIKDLKKEKSFLNGQVEGWKKESEFQRTLHLKWHDAFEELTKDKKVYSQSQEVNSLKAELKELKAELSQANTDYDAVADCAKRKNKSLKEAQKLCDEHLSEINLLKSEVRLLKNKDKETPKETNVNKQANSKRTRKPKEYKILQFERETRSYRKDEFEQIKELFKSLGWKIQNKPVHNEQSTLTCWKITNTYYDSKLKKHTCSAGLWLSTNGWTIEKINLHGRALKGVFTEYEEDQEALYSLFFDNGLSIED